MNLPDMTALSESELIQTYFAPLSGEGAFHLKDDCAKLTAPDGYDLVVTVDTVTEGVDFFDDAEACEVAAKALRVNLSDLISKGAKPYGYVLALSLPDLNEEWIKSFCMQLEKDQRDYGITLLGGDTTRAPLLSVTVTAFGFVQKNKMVLRSTAQAGDIIAVTGTIGDAALGLQTLLEKTPEHFQSLVERYRCPAPPIGFENIINHHASAAMDISDGFIGDLQTLCAASQLGAVVTLDHVPHSQDTLTLIERDEQWRDAALTGGDDYQVLFTVPPEKWQTLKTQSEQAGVTVTAVGKITSDPEIIFTHKKKPRVFARGSYQHFLI